MSLGQSSTVPHGKLKDFSEIAKECGAIA